MSCSTTPARTTLVFLATVSLQGIGLPQQLAAKAAAYSYKNPQDGRVVWEFGPDQDPREPVSRAVVEPDGTTTYLATRSKLYRVSNGTTDVISKRPEGEAQLALAPGGEVYAWLLPIREVPGLFTVRLMDMAGETLADLRLEAFPHGFSALYLGSKARLIVTATPLDGATALEGRSQYSFWDRQGRLIETRVRSGRELGIIGVDGDSFLLLGSREALAFNAFGRPLWQLGGGFRKAEICMSGGVAVLNPSSQQGLDEVHLFRGSGSPIVTKLPTPVHHLAVSPDGEAIAAAGDRGRYFYLDRRSGALTEGPPLPIERAHYITDLSFVSRQVLAMGVLQRDEDPIRPPWPAGNLVAVHRDGRVLFQRELPITAAVASRPAVDVAFGSRFVAGYTQHVNVLVSLGR